MKKVSFEHIKNVGFPESWIENALNVPNEKKPKPLLFRYYRYTIGASAVLVIAVCASLFLFFGSGNNSIIHIPSQSVQSTEKTDFSISGTGNTAVSSIRTTASEEYNAPVTAPEPSEDNSRQAVMSTNATDDKKNSGTTENQTTGSAVTEKPSESTAVIQEKTEQQTGTEVLFSTQTPMTGSASEPASESGAKRCVIICKIDFSLTDGSAYCKLVGDDGSVLGSRNLFDPEHKATVKSVDSGQTELTYIINGNDAKSAQGKLYFAVFYDGSGKVLKQSPMIYLYEDLYFRF